MTSAVRLLLVDDQQILRRGLTLLFDTLDDVEVVAHAGDGREALAVLGARDDIDVVLSDIKMPELDGVGLARECRDAYPSLPILLLTTFDEPELVSQAVDAGAAGFILKDASLDALADAVRAVHAGGVVIDPRVARFAFMARTAGEAETAPRTTSALLAELTPSERQVAEAVAEGLTNKEIAERLFLAEGTVKNHVSALLRKTGERHRASLALTLYKDLQDET